MSFSLLQGERELLEEISIEIGFAALGNGGLLLIKGIREVLRLSAGPHPRILDSLSLGWGDV